MVKAMDDARKGRKMRHRQPSPPAPEPHHANGGSSESLDPPAGRRPAAGSSSGDSTSTDSYATSSEVEPNILTRMQAAFQSLKDTLGGWFGRKPRSLTESIWTESDLERQAEQGSRGNTSHNNEHEQAPEGKSDDPPVNSALEEKKSIAPEDKSLPASRPTTVDERSTHASGRDQRSIKSNKVESEANQDASLRPPDGEDIIEDHRSMPSSNFDQRSRSSHRPPTIPPPQRATERQRDVLPTDNLNEHLIRGYYSPGSLSYQPRRSLDQYGYADIETTSHRDDDQVVYRYTKNDELAETKIFMVDQLWLWVIGKGVASSSLSPLFLCVFVLFLSFVHLTVENLSSLTET